jgi:hypothetical protein
MSPTRIFAWPQWNICIINDHEYVPLLVNTSRSFPNSWLITGFVTRLTRQVSLVEQELLTLPEHPSSPRSTKHTHKTKDWVTRTPLKTRGELGCSGRVSSSCSTSDTCRVNLVTNPVTLLRYLMTSVRLLSKVKWEFCKLYNGEYKLLYDDDDDVCFVLDQHA